MTKGVRGTTVEVRCKCVCGNLYVFTISEEIKSMGSFPRPEPRVCLRCGGTMHAEILTTTGDGNEC